MEHGGVAECSGGGVAAGEETPGLCCVSTVGREEAEGGGNKRIRFVRPLGRRWSLGRRLTHRTLVRVASASWWAPRRLLVAQSLLSSLVAGPTGGGRTNERRRIGV